MALSPRLSTGLLFSFSMLVMLDWRNVITRVATTVKGCLQSSDNHQDFSRQISFGSSPFGNAAQHVSFVLCHFVNGDVTFVTGKDAETMEQLNRPDGRRPGQVFVTERYARISGLMPMWLI